MDPRASSPSAHREFCRLLDLFPTSGEFDKTYVKKAKVRGWETFRHLPAGSGREKILDVGSMGGLYAPAYVELWGYAEAHLVGTDSPANGVVTRKDPARGKEYSFPAQRCNIELERWPFPDAMFDTVVCTEVLEHMIFDPVFVMNEMNRVMAPGGHALITIPNTASDSCLTYLVNNMQPGFLRQYFSDPLKSGRRDLDVVANLGHFHEYTGPELDCLARATGFDVLFLGGLTFFPPDLDSFRFRLLKHLVRRLFPRSKRVREDHLVAVLRKKSYTPLEQLPDRYPPPLYRPLTA